MNAIPVIVSVIRKGGYLGMVCCIVPTADHLAIERLEMVAVLWACDNRRGKHVFSDVQLKVTDEQQNTFDVTNMLINFLEAQI